MRVLGVFAATADTISSLTAGSLSPGDPDHTGTRADAVRSLSRCALPRDATHGPLLAMRPHDRPVSRRVRSTISRSAVIVSACSRAVQPRHDVALLSFGGRFGADVTFTRATKQIARLRSSRAQQQSRPPTPKLGVANALITLPMTSPPQLPQRVCLPPLRARGRGLRQQQQHRQWGVDGRARRPSAWLAASPAHSALTRSGARAVRVYDPGTRFFRVDIVQGST